MSHPHRSLRSFLHCQNNCQNSFSDQQMSNTLIISVYLSAPERKYITLFLAFESNGFYQLTSLFVAWKLDVFRNRFWSVLLFDCYLKEMMKINVPIVYSTQSESPTRSTQYRILKWKIQQKISSSNDRTGDLLRSTLLLS